MRPSSGPGETLLRKGGVADGGRTRDLRSHNPVLYQLSYSHHYNYWNRYPYGRGRGIRTPDILLPKQARYQTALFPALPARHDKKCLTKRARIIQPDAMAVN